jgi:2-aminoadipate transaminase
MLRSRTEAVLEALEQEMPEGAVWTRPEGGYQVWLELPFDVDTRDLLADAVRQGVVFAPGSQFYADRGPSRGLRLTLAQANEAEIRRGVAILGEVIRRRRAAGPTGLTTGAVNM